METSSNHANQSAQLAFANTVNRLMYERRHVLEERLKAVGAKMDPLPFYDQWYIELSDNSEDVVKVITTFHEEILAEAKRLHP